jgi:hypothetical protein
MNIALRPKRFRHTLTVIDIHLTPVCFDEQLFRVGHCYVLFGKFLIAALIPCEIAPCNACRFGKNSALVFKKVFL